MRIPERLRAGAADSARCGKRRGVAVRAIEVGEAAARADGVDMALGEDRAQPSLERASPVEITEQGAAVGSFAQPIEIREQRICQFARCRRVRRAAQNGARGGTHVSAKRGDEMIPRMGAAFGTGASERQVLEVQRGKVFFDLAGARRFFAEAFAGAVFEGGCKQAARQSPGGCAGSCK